MELRFGGGGGGARWHGCHHSGLLMPAATLSSVLFGPCHSGHIACASGCYHITAAHMLVISG